MPMGLVANLLDKYLERGYKGAAEWWPLGVQGPLVLPGGQCNIDIVHVYSVVVN